MTYISVFIGGGLGSVLRYFLSHWNGEDASVWNTWGTFAANMLSCLVLGVLLNFHAKYGLETNLKLLLLTGFCGGFSTFSTFSNELFQYVLKGAYVQGAIYLLLSLVLSIVLIIAGMRLINV